MSIERSGVSRCGVPSMCERKAAPSSVIFTRFDFGRPAGGVLDRASSPAPSPPPPRPRLKIWNPPESVSMGPSQPMKRCSPPIRATISGPGWSIK